MKKYLAFALVVGAGLASSSAMAQTAATGNFNVRMTVVSECKLITTNDLSFGSTGIWTSNIDQGTNMSVQCTNSTPYTVALGTGSFGTSVADRRMKNSSSADTIAYQLYRDTARTQVWGTAAGDTLSGTGTGVAQTLTVYGRVPVQGAVAVGSYSDTITVTVSY